MEQFLRFKKTLIVQMLITAAIVAVICFLLNHISAAKGFVLGSFFSIANFLLMIRNAPRRLSGQGKVDGALNLVLRMAVLALPLYAAIRLPDISLIWTVFGILNLQVSIFIYGFIIERFGLVGEPTVHQGR